MTDRRVGDLVRGQAVPRALRYWPVRTEPQLYGYELYLLMALPGASGAPLLLPRAAAMIGLPYNRTIRAAHGLVDLGLITATGPDGLESSRVTVHSTLRLTVEGRRWFWTLWPALNEYWQPEQERAG